MNPNRTRITLLLANLACCSAAWADTIASSDSTDHLRPSSPVPADNDQEIADVINAITADAAASGVPSTMALVKNTVPSMQIPDPTITATTVESLPQPTPVNPLIVADVERVSSTPVIAPDSLSDIGRLINIHYHLTSDTPDNKTDDEGTVPSNLGLNTNLVFGKTVNYTQPGPTTIVDGVETPAFQSFTGWKIKLHPVDGNVASHTSMHITVSLSALVKADHGVYQPLTDDHSMEFTCDLTDRQPRVVKLPWDNGKLLLEITEAE